MEVKINFPENNNHISNLAYIKALMIKKTIEDLNISSEEKEKLRKEVLEHLRKTWNKRKEELESHKKIGDFKWKRKLE